MIGYITRRLTCECGECITCRKRETKQRHRQRRLALPQTFEEALRLYETGEAKDILWPPVQDSVAKLDEKFPHLRVAWEAERRRQQGWAA